MSGTVTISESFFMKQSIFQASSASTQVEKYSPFKAMRRLPYIL